MNSSRISAQFPSKNHGTYFNHAAVGPWPLCAAEAVQQFAEENAQRGPTGYSQWIKREERLREHLVMLLSAPSVDDIALLKNTTECISTVAWGLDWKRGDNVVVLEGEFPSNLLPWLAQSERGVKVRRVDPRETENAEAGLISAMDENTRLLAVSSVRWSDGFRLNLKTLGKACRNRGILFLVDAIQQLGALGLDVESCHIDFLAADAHKWLLGPEGVAVFYTSQRTRPLLALRQQGWHMYDNPFHFNRTDWTPAATARRFEAGSPNSLGQVAMNASLELLLETGLAEVEKRVLSNTGVLIDGLGQIPGVAVQSDTRSDRRSGIVNFSAEQLTPARIHAALMQRTIYCTVRGPGVRLSPHFYQGEAEIEQVLSGIAEVLRNG
ncbi:MAG TPA: aminotransferase class V-fold PLP-dependent enzyme [Xanthomonadales bacterium]|nr:aminotransferase class V-fold PLP-dependent enzyme [Xanthomonadales bacterium]